MGTLENWSEIWSDPPAEFRGAPFWSWNSKLDPDRLCRAIETMHNAGLGGFFMHSRYGLKTEYLSDKWFACIGACIAKARELGMKAYLYDEDRWPSGSAGGAVTRENPACAMHYIRGRSGDDAGENEQLLASFRIELDSDGFLTSYSADEESADDGLLQFALGVFLPTGWHNDAGYADTMNGDATDEFIALTHQGYADRYGKDFGGQIPAIFTDEPNYFHPYRNGLSSERLQYLGPWTAEMPREFIARRGYDLRDRLPELFFNKPGQAFSKVRHDYYLTLTELFVENFTARIGKWCDQHDIALTGHFLSEGSLAGQVTVVGATMPHYPHMRWPGIDILCDQADELLTAKQCSSVAAQLAKPRVLSELYGCTGWDWPLEGHKFIGDWQLACGVNFRCPHLTHYSLAGGGKRDYPASIFSHSPWWGHYKAVEDYFARLCFMLTRGKPIREILVVHPISSAWGLHVHGRDHQCEQLAALDESLRKSIYALTGAHCDYDLGDESVLAEHAKATGEILTVGQMSYKLVVVPACWTLRSSTVALLKRFISGGGKVLFAGRQPNMIDGEPGDELADLIAKSAVSGDEAGELIPAVEGLLGRRVSVKCEDQEAGFVWTMLRSVPGGQLLFAQSHDRKRARRVSVAMRATGPVVRWDPATGRRTQLESRQDGKSVRFSLDLPPTGSALVSAGLKVPDTDQPAPQPQVTQEHPIEGPWPIEPTEPNSMPLDYCRFAVGDEDLSDPVPTLEADRLIRERFGLGDRVGYGCQPWYLYATGNVDVTPRGACRLVRNFHVKDMPRKCLLAIERPGDFEITVNGKKAANPAGWWIDEDIETIDITRKLRRGENEIVQTFDYRPDMELEDAYLVGDFGVEPVGPSAKAHVPGQITIVAPPTRLAAGSWVGQGLDFYGGAVRYRLNVARPSGARVRISLPDVACTAVVVHVGEKAFPLLWPPYAVEITDALPEGESEVVVEVIGGRKNILGPLHTPWQQWTGPRQFDPADEKWQREYLLNDHGLIEPPVVELLE